MAELRSLGALLEEGAMQTLATRLAPRLEAPLVMHLQGDLGAGKTSFCRALIQGLGHRGRVKSPTYGLLEHYPLGEVEVLHLDLYRLANENELRFLGISDLFDSSTILMVEWPEKGGRFLPPADVVLRLAHADRGRRLRCEAHSDSGKKVCKSIAELVQRPF